jgi:hypothetical protein
VHSDSSDYPVTCKCFDSISHLSYLAQYISAGSFLGSVDWGSLYLVLFEPVQRTKSVESKLTKELFVKKPLMKLSRAFFVLVSQVRTIVYSI